MRRGMPLWTWYTAVAVLLGGVALAAPGWLSGAEGESSATLGGQTETTAKSVDETKKEASPKQAAGPARC